MERKKKNNVILLVSLVLLCMALALRFAKLKDDTPLGGKGATLAEFRAKGGDGYVPVWENDLGNRPGFGDVEGFDQNDHPQDDTRDPNPDNTPEEKDSKDFDELDEVQQAADDYINQNQPSEPDPDPAPSNPETPIDNGSGGETVEAPDNGGTTEDRSFGDIDPGSAQEPDPELTDWD